MSAGNEFLKGLTTQWAMNNGGDIIVPITDPQLVKILEQKAQQSPAFLPGKSLGDIISILQGLLEIGSGGIESGSGIALAPTTGSASLVLTVDGAIRIVHGGKVIISATGSLTKTLNDLGEDFTHFLESRNSQNTPQSNPKKPWRGDFVLNDGNLKKGWIHIESRHITGTHPSTKHADMFKKNTTRVEVEKLAKDVVKNGTRVSNPKKTTQVFQLKRKFQGKRQWFKAVIDTVTEELVTVYPARSE